jgi:glycosyltransferase involved in cell wall biosynthesis
MNILILNQTFHPDVASTGQLMWDLARHLTAAGHTVKILTSRQYYGTDRLHDLAEETLQGIHIKRVRGTAFGKKNILGRLSDFATFYLAAALELLRGEKPHVILALTSPPLIAALPALLRVFHGGQPALVHHVMDLYPEALSAHGMMKPSHPLYRIFRYLNGVVLARASSVIALGHDMKELLLANYPNCVAPENIHVVQPWAEGDQLSPIARSDNPLIKSNNLQDTFNIVYSGNLGLAHDVDTITQAIQRTKDDTTLRWVFVGSGKRYDSLKLQAAKENWPNARFLPFAPREMLNQSLNMADVHLVSQLPEFTGIVVPSKLYGILAVGKPTIMVGPPDCECSRAVREHNAGLVVNCGDVDGLINAVTSLRDNPALRAHQGTNARDAFARKYDRPVACSHIERILSQAAFPAAAAAPLPV